MLHARAVFFLETWLPVSKATETLDRVLRGGSDANIRFDDLRAMLKNFGFTERIKGDHHIFTRDGIVEILNLQPRGGNAKPYQVKQVRGIITSYRLATDTPKPEAPLPDEATEKPPKAARRENRADDR
jgi:hypothetical protein